MTNHNNSYDVPLPICEMCKEEKQKLHQLGTVIGCTSCGQVKLIE